jgi:O-antigen/teichoic acid export membrane protein
MSRGAASRMSRSPGSSSVRDDDDGNRPGRSRPLPPGTGSVGAGLVLNGLCTYASLVVARGSLSDESYAAFAVLWGLLLILGPGLFQPLQQETARAASIRAADGVGARPVLEKAAAIGMVAYAVVVVVTVVGWRSGLDRLLDGDVVLLGALLLGLAGYMGSELARGVLAGRARFGAYGRSLTTEGVVRLAAVAAVAAIGVASPGPAAIAVALSFAAGAVACLVTPPPFAGPGPGARWSELTPALGLLLTMSLSEAFLLNIGPAAIAVLSDDATDPGRFLNALVIARVPLFLFQAVKIALLPSLVRSAAIGDLHHFSDDLRRLVGAVLALVVVGIAGAAVIGPTIVELLFADTVSSTDLTLLATANGTSMLVSTLGVGLVALGRHRLAAVSLLVGVSTFGLALAIPVQPFLRIELALCAAFAASGVAMAASMWFSLGESRRRRLELAPAMP